MAASIQTLRWRTEVPLLIPGDLRAWDATIVGPGFGVGVEAETRLRDLQAAARRTNLKQRDGELDHVILLVADTRAQPARPQARRGGSRHSIPGLPA